MSESNQNGEQGSQLLFWGCFIALITTSFAFITTSLLAPNMVGAPPLQLAKAATLVAAGVYGVGVILSFFLPEPQGTDLPE